MDQIVHLVGQSCIIDGSEVKISLCIVRFKFHYIQGFVENARTPYKLQVFHDPKWSTKFKSTWWRFIQMDSSLEFKSFSFFFGGLRSLILSVYDCLKQSGEMAFSIENAQTHQETFNLCS